MIRTQVQIPDALFGRIRRYAEIRETSIADVFRNALELFINVHAGADAAEAHVDDSGFVIAEQTLVELYCLLRNPVVQKKPLSASEAVAVISAYRRNPAWTIIDIPAVPNVMDAVWRRAASKNFARRRIHDVRLAETLKYWGVDEFHTRITHSVTSTSLPPTDGTRRQKFSRQQVLTLRIQRPG